MDNFYLMLNDFRPLIESFDTLYRVYYNDLIGFSIFVNEKITSIEGDWSNFLEIKVIPSSSLDDPKEIKDLYINGRNNIINLREDLHLKVDQMTAKWDLITNDYQNNHQDYLNDSNFIPETFDIYDFNYDARVGYFNSSIVDHNTVINYKWK